MAKRSKAYEAAAAKIDAEKFYAPFEAVTLAKDTNPSKFDATVEVAFRLGVDPRKIVYALLHLYLKLMLHKNHALLQVVVHTNS